MENNVNEKTVESPNNLGIDKQIFADRPIGKITVGKLLLICNYVAIGILFILFFFTGLVCLHAFNHESFWNLSGNSKSNLNSAGVSLIVVDTIILLCSLVLQIYIYRYKINFKKKFWKKIFWSLVLVTILFMLFGISDSGKLPWIYARDGSGNLAKSGGWWLILGIFIGVSLYLLVVSISGLLPDKIKKKLDKIISRKSKEDKLEVVDAK